MVGTKTWLGSQAAELTEHSILITQYNKCLNFSSEYVVCCLFCYSSLKDTVQVALISCYNGILTSTVLEMPSF